MRLEDYIVLSQERTRLGAVSDDDAVAQLNALTLPSPVPQSEVVAYLLDIDKWVEIQDSVVRGSRNLKQRLVIVPDNDFLGIDMTPGPVIRDVNGAFAGGDLTRPETDNLLGLGQNRISIAQSIGWPEVKPKDLGRLRGEEPKLTRLGLI